MGKRMLELFAENGANIFALARNETDEHKNFCKELEDKFSVKIMPVYFDLTNQEQIKEAVKIIRNYKLNIDGLVNNAGVTYNALFQMTDMSSVIANYASETILLLLGASIPAGAAG